MNEQLKKRKPRSCGPNKCNYIYKKTGLLCDRTCYSNLCSRHTNERIDTSRTKGLKHYYTNQLKKLEALENKDSIELLTSSQDNPALVERELVNRELYTLMVKIQYNIGFQQEIVEFIKERIKD